MTRDLGLATMGSRILLALLLLFQSVPLSALAAHAHCHRGSIQEGDQCPFHAPPKQGDHCARKPVGDEHHGHARTQDDGLHAAGCDCSHGSKSAARTSDPFLEPVLLDAAAPVDASVVRWIPPRPILLDVASTPPTPPPRLLSL